MKKDDFLDRRYTMLKAIAIVLVIYAALFIGWHILTAPNGDRVVYTTRTGECYHKSGCSSLRYSKFKTTIEEAVTEGYRRCNNCDPPNLIAGEVKLEFSLSNALTFILGSISLAFLVWQLSILLFYFLDIPVDQIKLIWYPVLSAIFLLLVLFI